MASEYPVLPVGQVSGVGPARVLVLSREGLAPPSLGPREQAVCDALGSELRRSEWLAGRAAAKALLGHDVEVLPDGDGRPHAYRSQVELPVHLSLSHSPAFAAAAVSECPVGVDLCDLSQGERLPRIERRTFADGEKDRIDPYRTAERQSAVWALKESALKATGGGVFNPGTASIEIESLAPPVLRQPKLGVAVYTVPGGVLALAWGESPGQ